MDSTSSALLVASRVISVMIWRICACASFMLLTTVVQVSCLMSSSEIWKKAHIFFRVPILGMNGLFSQRPIAGAFVPMAFATSSCVRFLAFLNAFSLSGSIVICASFESLFILLPFFGIPI